ncbi:alpha-galactosidase [Blautia stercoris]|uniref:Alpha-galactosidase n=1 Tax=Blautia stercoris TaxID=871664 RepID=A0ABR7PAU7_9FIRM|nr:alpha-galactosidase [Blautia stercoris]MBC8628522.1 alpha-galactosidase [Blautia stercoris]
MAITVKDKIFNLETENTLYQMKVDRFGVLNHLWYGEKTDCCMDYLLDYPDAGFSGNIYEAENERTYSLNTLPQEYSTSGVGDFRISAISVTHEDGSNALDLRVREYQIKKGKYEIPGLPAVYAKEDEAETLEITLKDTATEAEVILKYGVFEKEDVITRSVVVKNSGKTPIVINKVHSMCLDIPYGDWEWMHFYGRHTMERQAERVPVLHGISESSSSRGTSSHHQNPAVLLCEKDCTETNGHCIGAALMYSGGFQAQVEKDQLEQVRLVMGIHPDTFEWTLEAGEAFYTPEVILSCSTTGFAKLSQNFHHIIRNHVCRGTYQLSSRPVLINNWEATYFDFNEEKILNIARQASKLGIDMMVLDDGWFGKRDDDCSGLGDWFVNEKKLNGGLKALVEKINAMGMKFGLWFEPEMVSEDSDLYRNHPDWAIQIPGRKPMRSRYQLVLDMSNPEVVDYLYGVMSAILRENHIEYVKWDMNRSISDWYTATLSRGRQMEMPHRYVLGLYELLEKLTSEFPDVLFEGCSGGGGRFDAGMMYYCPQIWCSDDTDAHERTFIQYGTSFFYPTSTVGSHVSAVPNHQTGRITSIETRGVVAMAGSFGYELDLNQLSEEEKAVVAKQVTHYKEYQSLIYNGDYYRLANPFEDGMSAWSWISEDKKTILVQGVLFRAKPNVLRKTLRLMGLEAKKNYKIAGTEEVYTGVALMSGGVLLQRAVGDDVSFEIVLEEI